MRFMCAVLAALVVSATTAAAQVQPAVDEDAVIARVMSFDRDRDGRVTAAELSERMQGLVARGDRSGDGALDVSEVMTLATSRQQVVVQGLRSGYSFADINGRSTRNHIENSIDDLRLAPNITQEAKQIASAVVDHFEGVALVHLRQSIAPLVSAEQLPALERELRSLAVAQASILALEERIAGIVSNLVRQALTRRQLSDDQIEIAEAALETFKTEQQLDETRRNLLVAELSEILTSDESDDLRAALARRPLARRGVLRVKGQEFTAGGFPVVTAVR